MIRRLRNWLREVEWFSVIAVTLFAVAAVFAFLAWPSILVAAVIAIIGVGFSVLSLRV